MCDSAATPPQRTVKKLPFKPTALPKAASLKVETIDNEKELEHNGLDLFRRSKEMEPIMAADQERRLKKRRRHEDQRHQPAESSAKRPVDKVTERYVMAKAKSGASSQAARSTVAVASELDMPGEALASEVVTPPASKTSKRTRIHPTPSDLIPVNSVSSRLLFQTEQATVDGPGSDTLTPIVLDSDDDDGLQLISEPTKRRGNANPIESNFIAGDEDDDYIRKAEEQRVLDQALLGIGSDGAASKESIDILLTSIVPNTKPCCFKFLFDKQLRLARNTWFALQKLKGVLLDVEREEDIVLTWRRRKVYAFSTLLSLGIRPQDKRRAGSDGNNADGFANGRTRVHMEVWTLDLFREMECEEDVKRKRKTGELPDEEEPPAPEIKTRIILRARDIPDVKLTVRPTTTVETLITIFRTQRSIGPDRDVQIWFDGSRLEEHTTMDEAEIDDMDTLGVHVK